MIKRLRCWNKLTEREGPSDFPSFFLCGHVIIHLFAGTNPSVNPDEQIIEVEIIQKQLSSVLILISLSSTLLFALHLAIAGFGLNFALRYNAAPDARVWARIGTVIWLTVTPLLYLGILVLCISIQFKIKKSRT